MASTPGNNPTEPMEENRKKSPVGIRLKVKTGKRGGNNMSADPSMNAEVQVMEPEEDADVELKSSDIDVHRALGGGAYGDVYLTTIKTNPAYKCAMKLFKRIDIQERAISEYNLQAALVHPNIAQTFGFLTWNYRSAILLEYCDLGDLLRYMDGKCPEFPRSPERDQDFIRQIVTGVEYLHTQAKVIHMDIKADNVLLTSQGVVKVSDFGLSFRIQDQREVIHGDRGGTTIYKPPEFFDKPVSFDSTTDVWAIGCLVFEMMDPNGSHPFFASQKFKEPAAKEANQRAALMHMKHMRCGTFDYGEFLNWTPAVQDFLYRTLGTTRLTRPLISELLATEWLREEETQPHAARNSQND